MKILRFGFVLIVVLMFSGCPSISVYDEYRRIGHSAMHQKNYISAIRSFENAASMRSNPENHFWLGLAYLEIGQPNDAINNLMMAIKLNPKDSPDHHWLGIAYYRVGSFQEAVNAFKRSIELDPRHLENFIWLASAHIELKQYDEAITAAKRISDLKQDSAKLKPDEKAYYLLGVAYGRKKLFDEAFDALEAAMKINPKDAAIHRTYGLFLIEKNSFQEALVYMERAVALSPNDAENILGLSAVHTHEGRYDKALAATNKAIELQKITGIGAGLEIRFLKDSWGNLNSYLIVSAVSKDSPADRAGIQAGDRIIRVDGKWTAGWDREKAAQNMRGAEGTKVVLTVESKDTKQRGERTIIREAFFNKEAATSFGLRSLIHRYSGNLKESFKDAQQAHSLDPTNDMARISLGAAYLDNGRNDEAIKLLQQVKDGSPVRILEATAHARQKDIKRAVAVYNTLFEDDAYFYASVPRRKDLMALFREFKPFTAELRKRARESEAKGDHGSALAALSEAILLAEDSDAKELKGEMLRLARRMPFPPELPETARKHVLRGEAMIKNGEFENAVNEFRMAIKIAPYAGRLYFNTALVYANMKKYPEAIRHMKIFVEMAPHTPEARTAKDEIYQWEYLMEREGKKGKK